MSLFFLILTAQSAYIELSLNSRITLGWDFQLTTFNMNFTCKVQKNGYCGIGFGPGMKHTDMAIIFITEGSPVLVDAYSQTHDLPQVDTTYGGQYSFRILNLEYKDGVAYSYFERSINTNDPFDKEILPNQPMDFCFAWSDTADFHGQNYKVGKINFATSQKEAYFKDYFKYRDSWFDIHKDLMSIAWLGVLHIGVISARYFKWWKYWVYLHVFCNLFVYFVTIIMSIGAYQANEKIVFAYTSDQRYHSIIGLNINSLMTCQIALGLISKYFKETKSTVTPILFVRRLHAGSGFLLVAAGLAQCWFGWKMYDGYKKPLIAVVFGIICFLYIFFEVMKVLNSRNQSPLKNQKIPEYERLETLSIYKMHKSIKAQGKLLVFYENFILDLSSFITDHPGGQFIISNVIGQEVGKYLCGSASLPNFNPYSHSDEAFDIAKKLVSEEVGFDSEILEGHGSQNKMVWTVADSFKISETTFCITLSSDQWKVKFSDGYSWLGKSFIVTSDEILNTKRYYSIVLSNLNNWSETETNNIRLYIKACDKGKTSNYITSLHKGQKLIVKGPVGLGLMVDYLKPGNYHAFAGGTGINPFIDLIKKIWTGSVPEKFVFHLFLSFHSESEAYGLEVFTNTAKTFPENFKFFVSLNRNKEESLLKIKEIYDKGNIRKIWLCGPSPYCEFIANLCDKVGIDTKKILVL